MFETFFKGYELDFLIDIGISLLAGFIIGTERELKGKPAGISTHSLVIGGSMIFTFLSSQVGIGFLGAGVILKGEVEGKTEPEIHQSGRRVVNLTTAASIWFSGAIGMAIGFNYYFIALVSVGFVVIVSRLPRFRRNDRADNE